MFEDIKKDDEKVVLGDPGSVSDPFDAVDPTPQSANALAAGRIKPTSQPVPRETGAGALTPPQPIGPPQPLTNLAQLEEWSSKRSRRGVMVTVVLILAVAASGLAAAYVFQLLRAPQPPEVGGVSEDDESLNLNTDVLPVASDNEAQTPNTNNAIVPPPPDLLIDSDSDGLTNLEEEAIGTDPENTDTDGDSLNDRDERHVHKTNPLSPDSDNDALVDADELFVWATNPNNPDTDGDTYLDGTEVQNGYSPTGPGSLPSSEPSTRPPLPPAPQP